MATLIYPCLLYLAELQVQVWLGWQGNEEKADKQTDGKTMVQWTGLSDSEVACPKSLAYLTLRNSSEGKVEGIQLNQKRGWLVNLGKSNLCRGPVIKQ